MPDHPTDSSDAEEIVLEVDGPLGHRITLDQSTLDEKTTKHGERFTKLAQTSDLLTDPCAIYESQHDWAKAQDIYLYYREREHATGRVKFLRAAVQHVSSTSGEVKSIHPRERIGNVGECIYLRPESASTDEHD